MKYQISTDRIPQQHRAEVNEKIITIIDSGNIPEHISKEDIFNAYTGIGGLHGLERADYQNYFEYAEDKRDFEQGQFFTHASVVEMMVKDLQVGSTDTVCDLTCGAGAFFNYFKELQCYGCDIDHKAIRVAKYLYPDANIQCCDIRHYDPGMQFDFVIGNPPFSLRWEVKQGKNANDYLSQHYFCLKAAELLKPGGILLCIVPDSYLKDEYFTKSMIAQITEQYSFLFQYTLPADAFKEMGVSTFNTKVVCFQRLSESIPAIEYHSVYIQPEESAAILDTAAKVRHNMRLHLHRELLMNMKSEHGYDMHDKYGQVIRTRFMERVQKLLYEIKQHKVLQPHLPKALAKIHEYNTQKWPDGMKWEDWEKIKLSDKKLLRYLENIMKLQWQKPEDTYRLVADKYGVRFKAFSRKAVLRMKKIETQINWRWKDLVLSGALPIQEMTRGQASSLRRRQKEYRRQFQAMKSMKPDPAIDAYLRKFRWLNIDSERCRFNEIQLGDLNNILQKRYSILNWQQGSGKTAAAAAWAKYHEMRNTFIIGPALGINLTWQTFLVLHKKKFIHIKKLSDIDKIEPGMFVIMSLDYVVKFRKRLEKFMKRNSQRVSMIFDESDEITNPHSKRTYATLSVFRRVKRKLLTTGTTTRNNITELYSQLELLYNNSVNMTCFCSYIYKEKAIEGVTAIVKEENKEYRQPFPPRGGSVLFKQCFNPAKTTVFGIQQHNQSIYNEESLRILLEYTIITRKFKEIAGDKYKVINKQVNQTDAEKAVYRVIIKELDTILYSYFTSTGNSRKDSALRLVRQMQLLIDATSMPQFFKEYHSDEVPTKAIGVFDEISQYDGKIALGCTSLKAVEWYKKELEYRFPMRQVFVVKGEVQFNKRGTITRAFEDTYNGILVCTQQSLKSSVNIPSCDRVIIESKQWNIPKIEQFYFRFIRYDSKNVTEVVFLSYAKTIEVNLMALLMVKEKLNDYIKTLEYRDDSDIYDEYGVDLDILNSLITKEEDSEGKIRIKWGQASLVND